MQAQIGSDQVFDAIAAPSRRHMLALLAEREMPMTDLADSFHMTLSAVSQHLLVLRTAGLVSVRKEGRQRIYRLNAEPLKSVASWLETYEPFWKSKLNTLGDHLQRDHLQRDHLQQQQAERTPAEEIK